jgi:hypothetical protein
VYSAVEPVDDEYATMEISKRPRQAGTGTYSQVYSIPRGGT